MMKKFFGKVRRAAGFTMAEVLIVIAILAVLLTLAMPNVLAYFRELRLTELDDDARTIFLAAQNRLTALVNSGEADELAKNAVTATTPAPGGDPATPAVPNGLYMLSSDNEDDADAISLLLPAGSIESSLTSGCYIIYFFPNSGAVYSVWYCEEDDGTWNEYTKHTDKDDRLEQSVLVGYYGDTTTTSINRAEVGQLPIPKVTLTNAEELVLDITMPFESGSEIDTKKVTLEVTISSGSIQKQLLKAKFSETVNKTSIVLDTLKDEYKIPTTEGNLLTDMYNFGGQFKDIVAGTGIKPGADITLTVKVSYTPAGGEKNFTSQTVSVTGNSLFAFVSEDGKTANIAYGRHLQNLNKDTSDVEGITSAVQIREIDFVKENEAKPVESWASTYQDKTFVPIKNDEGTILSYNGNKLPIRNMTVSVSGSDPAGLFGEIKGESGAPVKLTDIVLADCAATSEDGKVGTLAGMVENVKISGCEVYLENKKTEKDSDEKPVILLKGDSVGGLIGQANGGCTITLSFASTNESGKTVGGLIGAGKAEINGCYAAGYLTGTENVGGLVGNADPETTVTDSYAAGIIAGEAVAGVNGLSDGTVERCYSAVRYVGVSTVTLETGVSHIGQSGVTFNGGKSRNTDTLKAEFTGGAWYTPANPAYAVFPYKQITETATLAPSYPYPMLKNDTMPVIHYGDWLDDVETIEGYFAYYEKYSDGTDETYGFHTNYPARGGSDVNSLCNNEVVVKDGYAFVSSEELTDPKAIVDGTEYQLTKVDEFIYELPYEAISGDSIKDYIQVSIGGNNYWFNPHFACEAWETQQPKLTDPIIVRTARQLANVSKYTNDTKTVDVAAVTWKYEQQLDIDFAAYTGWSEFKTGIDNDNRMSGAVLTGGSYNGNGHLIKNLYMNGGLFSSVTDGTLDGIRLVNVSVTGTGTVGGLVDVLSNGNVTNCGIYADNAVDYNNFTVASGSDASSYAGGLIGTASGNSTTISSSFAAVKVSGEMAGGFAYELNGVTVTNCYSGGHTENGIYNGNDPNVICTKNGSGKVGGFAVTANNTTFKGTCYSTCSIGDGSVSNSLKNAALFVSGDGNNTNGANLYALGKAFKKGGTEFSADEIKDISGVNTGADAPTAPAGTTITAVPYDTTLGNVYPYASNLTEHHGDWPGSAIVGFFYHETEGETDHFYILLWEKGEADANWHALGKPTEFAPTLIDTLCYDYHDIASVVPAITATDYGYFSITIPGSAVSFSVSTSTTSPAYVNALKMVLAENTNRSFDGYIFNAYNIGGSGSDRTVTAAMNDKSVSVTVNVDFAAMIATAGTTFGTDTTPYNVRTLAQLANVGKTGYVNAGKTFKQEHDLNAAAVTNYTPIGTEERTPFNGTYDGDGYRILELSITAEGFAGLFRFTENAKIKNVIMFSPSGTASVIATPSKIQINSWAGFWGSLLFDYRAAIASGIVCVGQDTKITNCAISGYTIKYTNSNGERGFNTILGGIAATVNGEIKNCEAVVKLEMGTYGSYATQGHLSVGGIVGETYNNQQLTVSNCYAGGDFSTNGNRIWTSGDHYIGGVAGNSSRMDITNCYSYVKYDDIHANMNVYAIGYNGSNDYGGTNAFIQQGSRKPGYSGTGVEQPTVAALAGWCKSHGYASPAQVYGDSTTDYTLAIVQVKTSHDSTETQYVFYGELPK